jgi:hypothetical protein
METKQILIDMLKQNTGCHPMDSGGTDGRVWQRNADIDLEKEPYQTFKGSIYKHDGKETVEFEASKSTFHFLTECLEYDASMQKRYDRYVKKSEECDWSDMMSFAENLEEATGIYGEGEPIEVNTYNHDSVLDQVIQYVYFEIDDLGYVVLQSHNGADVRGGYSTPKCFKVTEELAILNDQQMYTSCSNCDVHYDTDDGYHFRNEASNEPYLNDIENLKLDKDDNIICPSCNEGTIQ